MKDPDLFDLNPCTQGKMHPLQGGRENFLGYFTPEFFEKIPYETKRIALDHPENAKLHPSIRSYPVFVDHNEALAKHCELYVTGRKANPEEVRRAKEGLRRRRSVTSGKASATEFRLLLVLAIFLAILTVGLAPFAKMGGSVSAAIALLASGCIIAGYHAAKLFVWLHHPQD